MKLHIPQVSALRDVAGKSHALPLFLLYFGPGFLQVQCPKPHGPKELLGSRNGRGRVFLYLRSRLWCLTLMESQIRPGKPLWEELYSEGRWNLGLKGWFLGLKRWNLRLKGCLSYWNEKLLCYNRIRMV